MTADRPGPSTRARVWTLQDDTEVRRRDTLATEEPLEVRLSAGGRSQTVAVTMRTPGHDFELATGFLHAEGLLPRQPHQVSYCADVERPDQKFNVVTVEVDGPALTAPVRSGIVSSACGVCGSTSLDALRERGLCPVPDGFTVPVDVLYELPDRLRAAQGVFDTTGGLHGAGLFRADGELIAVREDIGRHNAVDKLVGWAVLGDRLPLAETVLMVSGRCGYEIVQKAVAAGIPVVASVSAPSSLAVAVAEDFGVTLAGFLRGRRCNVYAGRDRLLLRTPVAP
ncbi:MAG TPA: formate dehydrogenase accessory sulfurtransferase FdhD [Mycobacteriales bacterium]|nr:formate dehydrogenase accessory sulfurtransferase FdhD [Mycobacteriales bacterium]